MENYLSASHTAIIAGITIQTIAKIMATLVENINIMLKITPKPKIYGIKKAIAIKITFIISSIFYILLYPGGAGNG